MPTTTRKPKRKATTRAKKRKGKVIVKESAKLRSKGTKSDSVNALPIAPARVYPENAVHFKVKIRKK